MTLIRFTVVLAAASPLSPSCWRNPALSIVPVHGLPSSPLRSPEPAGDRTTCQLERGASQRQSMTPMIYLQVKIRQENLFPPKADVGTIPMREGYQVVAITSQHQSTIDVDPLQSMIIKLRASAVASGRGRNLGSERGRSCSTSTASSARSNKATASTALWALGYSRPSRCASLS